MEVFFYYCFKAHDVPSLVSAGGLASLVSAGGLAPTKRLNKKYMGSEATQAFPDE